MMRVPAFMALALLSTPASADGWSELWGVSGGGDRVEVSPSREWMEPSTGSLPENNDRYHVVVSADGIPGNEERIYARQLCVFARDKKDRWVGFACAKDGTSPLAGAAYKVTFINGCDFEYRFVCVTGCTDAAPRQMHYRWWEGPIRDDCPNAPP